ncbi:MAG: hypothetical protein LBH16_01955 [Treponema sp.]|jgi:hypothetical protein|nr:hypothetical protein [Treponema sp.]
MSLPLTQKSIDRSNAEQFSFSFFCDRCGKEWKSQTFSFKNGNFTAIENEEARQLIWAQEHKTAFEHANLEAHMQFSLCPRCGKWVCDDCFVLEERHEEVCRECSLVSVA